jgi:hypothetical protein
MSKKKHSAETIINKLREAEVLQSKGHTLTGTVHQLSELKHNRRLVKRYQ